MKVQSISNNNQTFGTAVRISEKGILAMRNCNIYRPDFSIRNFNEQIAKLMNNGKNDTMFIDGDLKGSKLTFILVNWINKRFGELKFAIGDLAEANNFSMLEIYENLNKQIYKLK